MLYVCEVYVCMYAFFVCVKEATSIDVKIYLYVCLYVCIYACMYVCIHFVYVEKAASIEVVSMYACMCVCMICMCVCICVCMYVCTCVCSGRRV